ncbi:hypothetical protein Tco_0478230 [Tanacetum coccineum]
MSVVFQAKSFLCLLRTEMSLFLFCSESRDEMSTERKEGSSKNAILGLVFASIFMAMNSSNLTKILSSRGVPLIE